MGHGLAGPPKHVGGLMGTVDVVVGGGVGVVVFSTSGNSAGTSTSSNSTINSTNTEY